MSGAQAETRCVATRVGKKPRVDPIRGQHGGCRRPQNQPDVGRNAGSKAGHAEQSGADPGAKDMPNDKQQGGVLKKSAAGES